MYLYTNSVPKNSNISVEPDKKGQTLTNICRCHSKVVLGERTLHRKCQSGKWNELSIPLTWDHLGPIKGSYFTYWRKNELPLFEGRWYTGQKIRQIWAEWAVCVNSYLKKGWLIFFPIGKKWTLNRSQMIPGKWHWKFIPFAQLTLPMECVPFVNKFKKRDTLFKNSERDVSEKLYFSWMQYISKTKRTEKKTISLSIMTHFWGCLESQFTIVALSRYDKFWAKGN